MASIGSATGAFTPVAAAQSRAASMKAQTSKSLEALIQEADITIQSLEKEVETLKQKVAVVEASRAKDRKVHQAALEALNLAMDVEKAGRLQAEKERDYLLGILLERRSQIQRTIPDHTRACLSPHSYEIYSRQIESAYRKVDGQYEGYLKLVESHKS